MPAQPGPALVVDGELDAGAPVEPVVVTGNRLHLDVDLEVGQPGHLLAHDVGLERALARQRDVLEVAAAAQPGAGERARWRDPVG